MEDLRYWKKLDQKRKRVIVSVQPYTLPANDVLEMSNGFWAP